MFVCDQLENGVSHRESKRSIPFANDRSGRTESSSHTAERNFVTETMHNGYENTEHTTLSHIYTHPYYVCQCTYAGVCTCRYLEEYLDSKRPMSPLSPLSDGPESTKPPSKTKTSEQHHVHKNRDKNRDSAIKVLQKKVLV